MTAAGKLQAASHLRGQQCHHTLPAVGHPQALGNVILGHLGRLSAPRDQVPWNVRRKEAAISVTNADGNTRKGSTQRAGTILQGRAECHGDRHLPVLLTFLLDCSKPLHDSQPACEHFAFLFGSHSSQPAGLAKHHCLQQQACFAQGMG